MELDDREFDLKDITGNFRLTGRIRNVFPFGNGHINDTYKVLTGEKNYLLQRVNQQVFMDVRGLTSNLIRVINYLSDLVENNPGSMQVMNSVRTINGTYFFIDDDANFWRMFDFVEGGRSIDRADNANLAEEGGKAFGWFIKSLDKFPVTDLIETIPDFHNGEFRLANFRKALEKDKVGRKAVVLEEIDFLEVRAGEMLKIRNLVTDGKLPLRVTHNDTKINNVLFNEYNKAICVIDLDTVMPGTLLYDFGDAIRTFTNTAGEDEQATENITMNIDLFKAFANGFLSETKSILQDREVANLAFSAKYITWEQAVRFLTDFLNGDMYYKTAYAEHNLVRTKAQIKLLQSMEEQFMEMERIIQEIAN
ncbi:MAG: aminoglycoside phosphotransferase family protein [Bacteroidales bacterium]|nr:aminoglycoside phosphotransferase family protein [Bacteroidales bacterium]